MLCDDLDDSKTLGSEVCAMVTMMITPDTYFITHHDVISYKMLR